MTIVTEDLLIAASEVEVQAAGKAPAVSIVAYTGDRCDRT